jgi:glycine/D-amino acid oxidase-like deaminating enzyme
VNYQERTYWLDTVSMPTGTDGPLPEAVDVAVIGAGFTGLSAAHTFAKHGVGVAVLEAKTIGWGASSRNGGMVLPGLKLGVEILAKRYGMEVTRRMYAATLSAIDCVEQIVAEESIDCNFSRCGDLQVACKPSHFNAYQKSAELMAREFNHQTRVVTKSELPAEIPRAMWLVSRELRKKRVPKSTRARRFQVLRSPPGTARAVSPCAIGAVYSLQKTS